MSNERTQDNQTLFNRDDTDLSTDQSAQPTAVSTQTSANTTSEAQSTERTGQLPRQAVGHFELLEERAVVDKERVDVGTVTVRKHTRTRTVEVPIELVEEVLTIDSHWSDQEAKQLLSGDYADKEVIQQVQADDHDQPVLTINGNAVTLTDEPVELVISRQVATISKQTYAVQDISIEKSKHTHTQGFDIQLSHEEIEVDEQGMLRHQGETDSSQR